MALWATLMTSCVSLLAAYYILSQTLLNPTTVKQWLNDSGAYSSLVETIVPSLVTNSGVSITSTSVVTPDMLQRAAKASIRPEDIRAKTEPVVDAVYAWLDSKSPEVNFSIETGVETDRLLKALRVEVLAKAKSLPVCTGYIDLASLEQATCLPWYVSPEGATDSVMQRVEQQDIFRDKKLTADSFMGREGVTFGKWLPSAVSALWVAQLITMPILGAAILFVITKRRAAGLIAVGSSLLTPGLALLVLGLLLFVGGSTSIAAFVQEGDVAAIAQPLGKVIAQTLANITLQVGGILTGLGALITVAGIWWRKRSRRAK